MNPKSLLRFLIAGWMSASSSAVAATYIVDRSHASADDANSGTVDLPWRTIGKAAETVSAGDTVLIRAGTYSESVRPEHSGDSVNGRIVFSAFPGERPVIDGNGMDANNGIVLDQSYVTISGLEIRNWGETGVWVEQAGFFVLSDCVVHDVPFGIGISDGAHDFSVDRVEAYRFGWFGFDASPSTTADCFNGTFNDCVAHTALDPGENVDGFALGHGTQHGFVFNRCTAYGVYDGFDISSRNTTLNGCLSYHCTNATYKIWQDRVALVNCIGYDSNGALVELDWDGKPGAAALINCTFFNSKTFGVWIENAADTLSMTNCILAGGKNIGLAFEQMGAGNYRGDYNLFQNDNPDRAIAVGYTDEFTLDQVASGAWTAYSGQDAHSVVVSSPESVFVDPAQYDLHLAEKSPAADRGSPENAPGLDRDGRPRPAGGGFDIGAYEYGSGSDVRDRVTGPGLPDRFQMVPNYPNPFNSGTTIRFDMPTAGHVRLSIFNLMGQEVAVLADEKRPEGTHEIRWDGLDSNHRPVPSGIYLVRIESSSGIGEQKLLLLR